MSNHNTDIPLNPTENLTKLEGIYTNLKSQLTSLEIRFFQKEKERDNFKALLNETDSPEELDKEEMELAAKREQLMIIAEGDMEDMLPKLRELSGRIRWNTDRRQKVQRVVKRLDSLKYKPFKVLHLEE